MATYKIIGQDQKQYNSVTEEQLRQWLVDGRVNAATKVLVEGSVEWKTLAEIPGFGDTSSRSVPPPIPIGKRSKLAIWALVLGILGICTCGLSAFVGLVLGIIALVQVKSSKGALRGGGMAVAAIITSGVMTLMLPISAALILPAVAGAHNRAAQINCMKQEKQLALAVMVYSGNNNGQLPHAAAWCDAIKPSVPLENNFHCPSTQVASECDYAFNARLDGLEQGKVNPHTVMIFESDRGWNANGGPELIVSPLRHKGINVAFADGHCEMIAPAKLATLRWDP